MEVNDYDALGRIETLTHFGPDATPADLSNNPKLAEFHYTHYDDGRKSKSIERHWALGAIVPTLTTALDYEYDALGRLTREELDSSDDSLDYIDIFTYELAGNRVGGTHDRGADDAIDERDVSTYDLNDRLITESRDFLDDSLD